MGAHLCAHLYYRIICLMHEEKLELLIDAALCDGAISKKEREIVLSKAILMGFTYEEFELMLNARLIKAQRDSASKSKFGEVLKCPACGAIVQSYQGKCNECGVEFEYIEANPSSIKLSEELKKIDVKFMEKLTDVYTAKRMFVGASRRRREIDNNNIEKDRMKAQVIAAFPLPTTKADLIEFITMMKYNSRNKALSYILRETFRNKYRECVSKAKHLFHNDNIINNLIKEFEAYDKRLHFYGWQRFMENMKRFLRGISLLGWLFISFNFTFICAITSITIDEIKRNRNEEKLVAALVNDDLPTAKTLVLKGAPMENLYHYMMNNGLYDEASEYVKHIDENYFKYIESAVTALCKKGNKEEARKFINRKISYFDKNTEGQYTTEIVLKRLNAIVDNY